MIGNFIGDFVKGKAWEEYETPLRNGILLHREIDRYTDGHEVVTRSKERLRPKYHHYAPVISDVFFDHFLASLWGHYHPKPLLQFTTDFYKITEAYQEVIPEKARRMLTYMKRDNWLYNYQFLEGIQMTLSGMSRRTPFKSKMEQATADLKSDYDLYKKDFEEFFPDLISHTQSFIASL